MAGMSGHTPGDWIYGVRRDGSMWLSIGDRRHGPHYQGDLVATEEDARLICAAPKLLEALMECRRVMLVEDSLNTAYGWADHVAKHVDPAIAAATGENA